MRKSLLALVGAVSIVMSTLSISAEEVVPTSISYNGVLLTEESIHADDVVEDEILPRVIIGYEYVPGYERLVGMSIEYEYMYVYGSSIDYVEGVSPTYTFMTEVSKTKGTEWNVSGQLEGEFNLAAVKANLKASGGYNESETIQFSAGQEWVCEFEEPGFYDIKWYMRGHKYTAQCGSKLIATGGNDGDFYYKTLGTVIFPTVELHVDISKIN